MAGAHTIAAPTTPARPAAHFFARVGGSEAEWRTPTYFLPSCSPSFASKCRVQSPGAIPVLYTTSTSH